MNQQYEVIYDYIKKHNGKVINYADMCVKCKIAHSTLMKYLSNMLKEGLIKRTYLGRQPIYSVGEAHE